MPSHPLPPRWTLIPCLGIVGILPLIATAIRVAKQYWDGSSKAKQRISLLTTELEALRRNLQTLHDFLRSDALKSHNLEFSASSVLVTCSSACKVRLEALCDQLGQHGRGGINRLLWPLKDKEFDETLQELQRPTLWPQFALSINGCALLSRTADDVLKRFGQQLRQFSALQSLQRATAELQNAVQGQVESRVHDRNAEKRAQILDWVSTIRYDIKHRQASESHTQSTGGWLLRPLEFIRWRDDPSSSNLLWCHGFPGSGKTVLASVVVDALMIQWLMTEAAKTVPRIYIVLDALDECHDPRNRVPLLEVLSCLKRIHTIRFFVTSRLHIHDIDAAFNMHPQIGIEAHEDDLQAYMIQKLNQGDAHNVFDKDFATKAMRTLISSAHGKYAIARQGHLRAVLNEPTLGDMEEALGSLSGSLPGAFEDTISRVQRLPASRARLGMRVLMWICHSKQVLMMAELGDALSGLATVDPKTTELRLAHHAIQEYLMDNAARLFPHAETDIALTCLTYLSFDEFAQCPCQDEAGIESWIMCHPFLRYASQHWGSHARELERAAGVRPRIMEFLSNRQASTCAHQVQRYQSGFRKEYYDAEECLSVTPLRLASFFGLERTCAELVENGVCDVDKATKIIGSTALILAASAGHVDVLRLLVQRGADPLDVTDGEGLTPLDYARRHDNQVVVDLLLKGLSSYQGGCAVR
ncbi:ankyrin repeats (many copies) domain-containing protein [Hirsutella rhossiliensis]|uniref:Ankyrin repeats (Many copies) domain-containing protein n=1 Tax=Hirsutella rhossiliensis TaxID=111463 RepID=A0A9P8N1K1_9HYPO|nr:ankyrin repeats (many copies) domain-containing protein [Hirsutella rhossiliensis]KAH0964912.1 ankyrin repeats (many copies) domain-containing protein [Hirsutella rhossiliensis]